MRPALVVLAVSAWVPGGLHAQEALGFRGQIRCAPEAAAPALEIANVLVLPQADSSQTTTSSRTGAFAFTLPPSAVDLRANEGPSVYFFLSAGPRDDAASDSLLLETLRVTRRLGRRFDRTRHYATAPIEVSGVPCSAIHARAPLGEAERADLVRRLEERGLVQFAAVGREESVLRGDAVAGGGGFIGQLLRSVGNLVVRAAAGPVPAPDATMTPADSAMTVVDTLSAAIGRSARGMGPSLSGLAHDVGFAFAPGPHLDRTPIWNPAGMLLDERVDIGLMREPDGIVQASAILPMKEGLTLGAYYYDFDRSLEYCDFGPASDCVDADLREGASPRPAGADTTVAGHAIGLVRNGSFVLRGDPMENHLGLEERVIGASAGFAVGPSIAIGVSGKWSRREIEVYRMRRTMTTVFYGDSPVVVPTRYELLRDTVRTEGLDVDVSALMLVGNTRIGANAMNLTGATITEWDGTTMTSRSLGIGVAQEAGRVNIGIDMRFFASGPVDWAVGAHVAVLGDLSVHAGYSAEYSGTSVGATFRTASYTFVDSDVFGRRHLIGTRVRF